MPSFKFLIFLSSLFVISLFSLPNGNEAAPTYNYHFCSGTSFTANSTYQSNLDVVLSSLSSNGTRATGFSDASAGEVSGLCLCRGDVNTTVCQDCVAKATKDILQFCPLQFGAVIWYDECWLHYSNFTILATINTLPRKPVSSSLSILAEKDRFNGLLGDTMYSLAAHASNSLSGKKFATREEKIDSSQTLYSLVQCTPDLTVTDCDNCIRIAIGVLPTCCDGKQGGRVLQPSCIVRYELYPFYNITAASPTFPPLPPGNRFTTLIILIVATVAFAVLVISFRIYFKERRPWQKLETDDDEIRSVESFRLDFGPFRVATDNFSEENKLDQGEFGVVYKGRLSNGQVIAVKRLSKNSERGDLEFINEHLLVAKLQHHNLVRSIGFCNEGNENLLIYEFMPNTSLDHFLFDPIKRTHLDWGRRYKIIGGIARGIHYLHGNSRLCIIHSDIKASNILLDAQMNLISDFGITRLFLLDQTQGNTSRIFGTYGYMTSEYAVHGQFSKESDVFNFGVLVLEIVSGQEFNCFRNEENGDDLLSYAWKNWREGTASYIVDATIRPGSETQIMRCIHIGLLCVQENVDERPTMALVVDMLSSSSINLLVPSQPAFFMHNSIESETASRWEQSTRITELDERSKGNSIQASANENSIIELCPL